MTVVLGMLVCGAPPGWGEQERMKGNSRAITKPEEERGVKITLFTTSASANV